MKTTCLYIGVCDCDDDDVDVVVHDDDGFAWRARGCPRFRVTVFGLRVLVHGVARARRSLGASRRNLISLW